MSQTAVVKKIEADGEYLDFDKHKVTVSTGEILDYWTKKGNDKKFSEGDTITFEVDTTKKSPKMKGVRLGGEAPSTGTPQTSFPPKSNGGFKRSPDTNRAIMAQTCLKAAVDFFKDRQNSSLEDVSNGTRYLLAELESILEDSSSTTQAAKPAIPRDFLDKLPNN